MMYERVSSALGQRPPKISHEEMRQRQRDFCSKIDSQSVAIITNNPVSIRSRDTHHRHRFNSYLHYLTGWHGEEGVAVFHHDGDWKCRLYVQARDVEKETWTGRRPGVQGAIDHWPVDESKSRDEMEADLANILTAADSVYHIQGLDTVVDGIVAAAFDEFLDPREILDEMRVFKSTGEIALMQYAADLAALAHIEAMRECRSGMGEWQLQSIIEGCFLYHQSEWAYPSIVGSGDNATILHYNENKDPTRNGDVVLIDAGCEIDGYASDITRSFPVNGKFTEAQREIYALVLDAQMAGIEACQVGAPWGAMHKATSRVLAQGLVDLGILDCTVEEALGEEFNGPYRQFFMHGTGHLLGLDVHDVGGGRQGDNRPERTLASGMVLTVEPGLYFGAWREDIEIDPKWAGIGIRIEDDVLITEEGPVILTAKCPKQISEIEALVGSN
ncbi:MAG: Xaa-Pro aminopeptidase [Euryarchaeota archaeon]|nr:Xaa-Pro aminopeptidase [Euryarchaeota archaeon]|tara:strand:+ start:9382 stop:10713 length:1332 start_codon:yes stop_codon:yes gene_type:complete